MITMIRRIFFAAAIAMASSLVMSCSDSGQATVRISLENLPRIAAAAPRPDTAIDRLLRFFSTPAHAQEILAHITTVTVRVTGPDMAPFVKTFPADTLLIVMAIEAGPRRVIEVTAALSNANPSAALSFQGSVTVDLRAGEVKIVPLRMIAHETRLVIPDFGNDRLVQLTLADGNVDWRELNTLVVNTNITINPISPADVDFDGMGRIVVLSKNPSHPGVYRINAFPATGSSSPAEALTVPIDFSQNGYTQQDITGIAVDRKRNILYCALYNVTTGNAILAKDLTTGGVRNITQDAEINFSDSISDIGLDSRGGIYVTLGVSGSSSGSVFKYDPATRSIEQFIDPEYNEPNDIHAFTSGAAMDVTVRDNFVYVTMLDPDSTYNSLVRYDRYLRNPVTISYYQHRETDPFYGPHRFVGWRERWLFFIDDYDDYDRIVGIHLSLFNNPVGESPLAEPWLSYGASGAGEGQFMFFE
jgi:hypothetical protein